MESHKFLYFFFFFFAWFIFLHVIDDRIFLLHAPISMYNSPSEENHPRLIIPNVKTGLGQTRLSPRLRVHKIQSLGVSVTWPSKLKGWKLKLSKAHFCFEVCMVDSWAAYMDFSSDLSHYTKTDVDRPRLQGGSNPKAQVSIGTKANPFAFVPLTIGICHLFWPSGSSMFLWVNEFPLNRSSHILLNIIIECACSYRTEVGAEPLQSASLGDADWTGIWPFYITLGQPKWKSE